MKLQKVHELNGALPYLSVKDLSVAELKDLLKTKKALTKIIDEVKELQIEVMKKYGVQEQNGHYDWNGENFATQKPQIDSDIKSISEADYEIAPLNFLPFEKIKSNNSPAPITTDSIVLIEILTDALAIQ